MGWLGKAKWFINHFIAGVADRRYIGQPGLQACVGVHAYTAQQREVAQRIVAQGRRML